MIILLPLLICLVGLVMYFVSIANAKVQAVGLHMFWVGLLAFLLTYHGQAITVVR